MPDSLEKIKAAREKVVTLMKQGKYDQAIGVLLSLDHPKAGEWIKQVEAKKAEYELHRAIDAVEVSPPPARTLQPQIVIAQAKPQQRGCLQRIRFVVTSILLVCVCATIWALTSSPGKPVPEKPFNQEQYTDILAKNVSSGFSSATLDKVIAVQDSTGHVSATLTFLSGASDLSGQVDEWITIFRSVSTEAKANGLKIDEVALVMGDALGNAVATIIAKMPDIRAYQDGKITRADFINRVDIQEF